MDDHPKVPNVIERYHYTAWYFAVTMGLTLIVAVLDATVF